MNNALTYMIINHKSPPILDQVQYFWNALLQYCRIYQERLIFKRILDYKR